MQNFKELGLPQNLMRSLELINFNTPTPIQAQAIPPALEGKDILGSAQTGTGKTGAFGIPLVAHLIKDSRAMGLILTPTRELAVQVENMLKQLIGKDSNIKTSLLIGGEPMPKQLQQLRARPRLIIGTPGRINDHLRRGSLMLNNANFLVLDETDRMLDMGFGIQLDEIVKFLPQKRQSLMFSATMPHNIVRLAQNYLKDPVRITVGSTISPAANIQQETIKTNEAEKYGHLIDQLNNRGGSVIVFVKTKFGAEKMAKRLRVDNLHADAIHGDLRQNKRDRVIKDFRAQKFRILVATDVASRGLDIPHIEHVINYDLPQCPEDYIHRIGRTARAGAEGAAVNIITAQDNLKWRAINKLMNPSAINSNEKDDSDGSRGGYGKSKRGGNKSYGAKTRSDGNSGERGYGDRRFDDNERRQRPRFDENQPRKNTRTDGGFGTKNRNEVGNGERSYGERRSDGNNRFEGNRSRDGNQPRKNTRSDSGFGTKNRNEASNGERSFSTKSRNDGNSGERSFGQKRSDDNKRRERPRFDENQTRKNTRSDSGFGTKNHSDDSKSERSFGTKSRNEVGNGERSYGERRSDGNRSNEDNRSQRSHSDRNYSSNNSDKSSKFGANNKNKSRNSFSFGKSAAKPNKKIA